RRAPSAASRRSSPDPSWTSSGARPGRMPISPSKAGSETDFTSTARTSRSGVTTDRRKVPAIGSVLHPLGLGGRFLDRADVHERLVGQVIPLAVAQLLERADGVLALAVDPLEAGELLGDEERLRQKALDLARPADDQLVVLGQL